MFGQLYTDTSPYEMSEYSLPRIKGEKVESCGQSYKASTLVNYNSRVVTISSLLVITTLEL